MLTTERAALVAFHFDLKGRSADELVWRLCAANMSAEALFMGVDSEDIGRFGSMLPDADKLFALASDEEVYFCALYPPHQFSPLARVYAHRCRCTKQDMGSALRNLRRKGSDFPLTDGPGLRRLIGESGRRERVRAFRRRLGPETAHFKAIHRGRRTAGVADEGILLASDLCSVCKKPYEGLSTSTFIWGLMLGVHLCPKCQKEAERFPSLFHFVAEKFGGVWPFEVEPVSREDIYEMGERVLRDELACSIVKRVPDRYQVTGRRESGYKVIVRVTSTFDYAYVILDARGKQVYRFDAADHHGHLPVQPDHEHTSLPEDNGEVRSSFLTGIPQADVARLREILEQVGG